ncbi:uncharacterized protein LOC143797013 [Ranitomeya variabilis]|uniref:uncharacterized protein LOC143797013 n=1 Tax=Ranitomeya variabilis TaxID=490064 RepID=UPI004056B18A
MVLENYNSTRDELNDNLDDLWERVASLMSSIQCHKDDAASLQDTIRQLDMAHSRYKRLSANKADSTDKERDATVEDAKDKAELHIAHLEETRSHRSASSKHSVRSNKSSCSRTSALSDRDLEAHLNAEQSKLRCSYTEKKAKAEALAKILQAEAEAKAEAKKAEAEAGAKILQTEMEEEIALAEVKILKQALKQNLDPICLPPQEGDDPAVRTSDYVQKQIPVAHTFSRDVQPNIVETSKSANPMVPVSSTAPAGTQDQRHDAPPLEQSSPQDNRKAHSSLLPQFKQQSSESIHPSTPHSLYARGAPQANTVTRSEGSDMSEFARFMVSRELISTSFSKFDNRAENYRAWKATFKATIADLNLSAEQELDLMVKCVGPESTNCIKSLRTVYVYDCPKVICLAQACTAEDTA